MSEFDPTKPVQTRDGRKARILCTDLKHAGSPIAAAVAHEDGTESVYYYCADGRLATNDFNCLLDLINIPERVTKYASIYGNSVGTFYFNLETALRSSRKDCCGILVVHFENGKLVSVELVDYLSTKGTNHG